MGSSIRNFLTITIIFFFSGHQADAGDKEFPYRLNKTDYGLVPAAVFLNYTDNLFLKNSIKPLSANEILALNKMVIGRFDRSATRNWSPTSASSSDITRAILVYSPIALFLPELGKGNMCNVLTLGGMYLEALMISQGSNAIAKSWVGRKRPFLYNTSLSDDYRILLGIGKEAYKSFFSAHTSGAFCSAVFLSKTFTDIYGKSALSYAVWGASLTLAGVTGYLRYDAGVHFPTDIIAGAVAGGAIGYLIPVLHKKKGHTGFEITALSPEFISLNFRF